MNPMFGVGDHLGAGTVRHRYIARRMVQDPSLEEIPRGAWAEKEAGSELWCIVVPEDS